MDDRIRLAAFAWLKEQTELFGDTLPRNILADGFSFSGQTIRLVGPQGIWKPAQMDLPLSISTIIDGPYEDGMDKSGLLNYKYRRGNPNQKVNAGLREVMRLRKPLIYFFNIFPNKYLASYPVFIVNDDPVNSNFKVAIDDISYLLEERVEDTMAGAERRSYITRTVLFRAHQRQFRERVISAYRNQCALCHLKHTELLDAAHIIGDREEHGDPVVQNGLSLCKIHHAAFDNNIIGITPDYDIKIRKDILLETDGPMLKYGIQSLNNARLILPAKRMDWPDKERLEIRYTYFKSA